MKGALVDLSFTKFDKNRAVGALPADLAMLMVHMAARQAASPTAAAQAKTARVPLDATLFAPVDGAFNGPVARAIVKWKDE